MPSRIIIVASLALAAGIILAAAPSPAAYQNPPRDRRPGEAAPETTRERDLKLALDGTKVDPYLELARLQQARGAIKDVEATLLSARKAFPADRQVLQILTGYYRQIGAFDKTAAVLEETARLDPSNKQAHQVVAAFYWERVSKDPSLTPEQKRSYIDSGLAATERALAIDADYIGALGYRGLLLRARAASEPNPATQQSLVAEADALGARAAELTKSKTLAASGSTVAASPSAPAIPVQKPGFPGSSTGYAPVRVGGNIKPPMKTKDVRPVYPEDAKTSKVQGVVILEVTVDPQGMISDARILRGVPMLDQAAFDAVSQWEFEPTQLNGAPVPVIMTVTVNFTLQ